MGYLWPEYHLTKKIFRAKKVEKIFFFGFFFENFGKKKIFSKNFLDFFLSKNHFFLILRGGKYA